MKILIAAPVLMLAAGMCSASSIVFTTPPGSSDLDGPVTASVTFTPGNGALTIQITDLLSNPTSVGQLVSGLQFDFVSPITGQPTLTTSSGQEVSISSGAASYGSTVETGWGFGAYQSGYIVCVICPSLSDPPSAQPSHLIIGPGPYTNAKGSINGNKPHNPFLNQTATFTISNSSITPSTTFNNVVFTFGTTFGQYEVPGVPNQPGVPEPGPFVLLAAGCVLLAGYGWMRRRAALARS